MPFPQRTLAPMGPMPLRATFQGPGMTPAAALPPMPSIPQQTGGGINPMSMMMQYMMWKNMANQAQAPLGWPTGYEGVWSDFMGGPTGAWGLLGQPNVSNLWPGLIAMGN